jgi:formyl-CoA transferase
MASGPLDGVRILEFTQIIAGPLGGMLLSDMGAEVIKIEPPQGEPWRLNAQFVPLESKSYHSLNRGKQGMAMDLRRPECQQAVHKLGETADVVITNSRPGVAEDLKYDYETLRAIKPDLIYVDSSDFGLNGPMGDKPGYDIVIQSFAGLTAGGGRFDDEGNPVLPGGAIVDGTTGYAIAWAVCAALYHRAKTGRGQFVETSLLANALMIQYGQFMSLPAADAVQRETFMTALAQAREEGKSYREFAEMRRGLLRRGLGRNIYYRIFNTKNGAVSIGNLSASLREKMRQAIGVEDIRDEPGYDPMAPESRKFQEELTAKVEAMFASKPTEHWVDLLNEHGVPVAPVMFIQELLDHPQIVANGYASEVEHDLTGPQVHVSPPIQMSDSPTRVQSASPPLGRDNDRVLSSIGYSSEQIDTMRSSGAIR